MGQEDPDTGWHMKVWTVVVEIRENRRRKLPVKKTPSTSSKLCRQGCRHVPLVYCWVMMTACQSKSCCLVAEDQSFSFLGSLESRDFVSVGSFLLTFRISFVACGVGDVKQPMHTLGEFCHVYVVTTDNF